MQAVAPIRTEDYDLTCPITLRAFQDPVKATDGHTYERGAIVRWITDHGTSPLTRQVLDVNGLLPDYHTREKIARRPSLTGSSDIPYEPMIHRNPRVTPINGKVLRTKGDKCHVSYEKKCCRRRYCIAIMVLSAVIFLACGLTVGLLMRKFSKHVESKHSSALTISSPTYCRDTCGKSNFYYEAIGVSVAKAGKYHFSSNSHIETYGYLYKKSFDPLNPYRNLLAENNDSGKKKQFKFKVHLEPRSPYILVTTTSSPNVTGSFSITTSGPALVHFPRTTIVPTTVKPKTTRRTTSTSSIQSIYRSMLNAGNPKYCRPGKKCLVPSFYYQAIQINVSMNGSYRILSNSNAGTYIYVYTDSFNASNPNQNLFREADDSSESGEKQSQLKVVLHSGYKYTLVVTTKKPNKMGEFTVTTLGTGSITFL